MTAGYPDWQRTTQQQAGLLLETGSVPLIAHTYGPFDVQGFRYLWARFIPIGAPTRIYFGYASTQQMLDTEYAADFDCADNVSRGLRIANINRWVTVQINPTAPVAGDTMGLTVGATNGVPNPPVNDPISPMMSRNAVVIGAGATITAEAIYDTDGPAVWHAFITGAAWEAVLETVAGGSTVQLLDRMSSPGESAPGHLVYLPNGHTRCRLVNGTGVAQTAYLALTPDLSVR